MNMLSTIFALAEFTVNPGGRSNTGPLVEKEMSRSIFPEPDKDPVQKIASSLQQEQLVPPDPLAAA